MLRCMYSMASPYPPPLSFEAQAAALNTGASVDMPVGVVQLSSGTLLHATSIGDTITISSEGTGPVTLLINELNPVETYRITIVLSDGQTATLRSSEGVNFITHNDNPFSVQLTNISSFTFEDSMVLSSVQVEEL